MKLPARSAVALTAAAAAVTSLVGALPAHAATAPAAPTYAVHVAPQDPVKDAANPSHSAYENAVEPSIGADWKNGVTAYQADLGTYFVTFNDSVQPAKATWVERSPVTSAETLDPILYTDNAGTPAAPISSRTLVSQLAGTTSLSSFTDDAGASYTADTGGQTSGVDHQTFGGGPLSTLTGTYPASGPKRGIYYCSQDIGTADCLISLDGGLTFGQPNAIYTASDGVTVGCQGLHGHVRVRPDGTAMVPNKNCGTSPGSLPGATGNQQGVTTNSTDNTLPWTVEVIPDSVNGITDPSVSADAANTMYFGYGNGDGHAKIATRTKGGKWSSSVDVGAPLGIQQTVFPSVFAGSAGRAAFAFLGSTTPTTTVNGAPVSGVDRGFAGVWQAYVARTFDGGATWTTTQLTNDAAFPVQKGCIQLGGTCSHRNLFDFNDSTVDSLGRFEYGFAFGCLQQADGTTKGCRDGSSTTGDSSSDNTEVGAIARQACGAGLFADRDAALAAVCAQAAGGSPGSPVVPEAPYLPLFAGVAALSVGLLTWRRRTHRSAA